MSDPFSQLRPPEGLEPDLGAIKGRAKRIERRQRVLVSASAASVAAVALIAVLLNVGSSDRGMPTNLAQNESRASTDAPTPLAATVEDSSGSEAGKGTRTEGASGVAGSQPGSAEAPGPAAGGSVADSTFAASPDPLIAKVSAEGRPLGGAEFVFEVCNAGKEAVERDFSSSQRYDFTVSKDKNVVWTWSDDKSFLQMIGTERWGPGDCKKWSDEWDGRNKQGLKVANGEYSVVGKLTTTKTPVESKPAKFCSGLC